MNIQQLFFSLFIGGITIAAFYNRINMENKLKRKTYLTEPLILPIVFIVFFFMSVIMDGGLRISATLVDLGLLFLYISIYYAVLLLLLPLLRRIISAWACATLWLIPNLLYFAIYYTDYAENLRLIITVPRQWLSSSIWIWAIGFAGVVIWQLISHFRYRRFLLKDARDFTETDALSLWHNEAKRHGIKPEIPVLISEAVSTPITIGCFDRTMRLILPKQNYTDEELRLIFRHELRHIVRADTRTKMFTAFCVAICWFNPLSWIARRKASDDLELSCDEAVLADADEKTRKQYAELLLKNAGNSRGYTTCLSASANSLRYRLRHIMNPAKRFSGSVVVGVALFSLFMTVGAVAVADNPRTVQALVFDKAPLEIAVGDINTYKWDGEHSGYSSLYGWNESRLTEYIASLRVKQVYSGNYIFAYHDMRYLSVDYEEIEDGVVASLTGFVITDKLLVANIPYDDYGNIIFLVEDEIDWEYLNTLLDFDAEDPDPAPFPPDMLMYFDGDVSIDDEPMYAMGTIQSVTQSGENIGFSEHSNGSGVGGVSGAPVTEVRLDFTYPPGGDFTVKVENWERSDFYTISSSQLTDNVLPLADYSAHYTVIGTFASYRDTVYVMSFAFDIEPPQE